jgi:hypothetical protein
MTILAFALVTSLALAACGDDADPASGETGAPPVASPSEPTGPTSEPSPTDGGEEPASGSITYTAVDYGFDGPSELASGEIEITLENEGTEPHELVLFPVAEGTSVEDVMTFLEENPDTQEIPDFVLAEPVATFAKPGKVSRRPLVTSVEPGTYMMMCFIPSKEHDRTPHALLGMVREITVV